MSPSAKLTEQEKQNGKRAILIPSEAIQRRWATTSTSAIEL